MKLTIPTLLIFLIAINTHGQISTTKVAQAQNEVTDNTPYDSLENFLGKNVYRYVGQELFIRGKAESLRKYGYDGFQNNYTTEKYNTTNYEKLNGKYFKVLEVIKHPQNATKYYLKLETKESKDIIYYKYDSRFSALPFVVVGFFIKQKQLLTGQEFILRGRNWISENPMTDIKTGKVVSNFESGAKWKCVDLTIEEKYYTLSLILQNEKGEQIPLNIENIKDTYWVFKTSIAAKFDSEAWKLILDGKVKIGMTKEMCELSFGKPKSINETITSGKKTEQWVYSKNYLYFDNGILTAIQ